MKNQEKINLDNVKVIEIDGLDYNDYPKFSDAFISKAKYKNRLMNDQELYELNKNIDFIQKIIHE